MASVSFSVESSVDKRLTKFRKAVNKVSKPDNQLKSRADTISDLLTKAGY